MTSHQPQSVLPRPATVIMYCRPRGFSLVEVLIAIALMAFIMLGVTIVFTSVRGAVSAAQAVSSATRDARSAHNTLFDDLKAAVTDDDPFLLITNERRAAFLRESDLGADQDKNPATVDLDQNGIETDPGEDLQAVPLSPTYRSNRIDTVGFFVRDVRRKQTGTGGQVISPMGSRDAYIWYGHPSQSRDVEGTYFDPGAGDPVSNPANYFSSGWSLGRTTILLSPVVVDAVNRQQIAIDRLPSGVNMILAGNATASRETNPKLRTLKASRHDLVQATMADINTYLRAAIIAGDTTWWQSLVYRFNAVPSPVEDLTPETAALAAPVFLTNCRSFTVEYAGDFLTQLTDVRGKDGSEGPDGDLSSHDIGDPRYGQVTAAEPDGRIDFYTVETGVTTAYGPERLERVRFYGLPRDADGAGHVRGGTPGRLTGELSGVLPLRDVARSGASYSAALSSYTAPFERVITFSPASNYMTSGMRIDDRYVCVFGPGDPRPKLLRIVLTLEDPQERMGVGQTYEYVLQLGR